MRDLIKLVSEEGTGEFYTATRNKKNSTEKFRFKKFDKKLRKHVWFKEEKIK